MTKKRQTSPAGFTLVELLVGIAIISILAAILLTALPKVRQQAQSTQCAANLRSLYLASNVYLSDWRHWPSMNMENSLRPSSTGGDRWFNSFIKQGYIETYLEDRGGYTCMIADILICPANEENPGARYPWMSSPYTWYPNYAVNSYWGSGEGGQRILPAAVSNPSAILLIDTLSNPNGGACLYSKTDAGWNQSNCVIPRNLHGSGAHALLANGAIITVSPETHPNIEEQRYWDPRYEKTSD